MIARSVHQHNPEKQLDYPYFNQFLTNEITLVNEKSVLGQ